jgi:hypothetical protein
MFWTDMKIDRKSAIPEFYDFLIFRPDLNGI